LDLGNQKLDHSRQTIDEYKQDRCQSRTNCKNET